MEKQRSQHLPQTLIERMGQEKEYSTYSTWIKSHWTATETAMPDTQIAPLTQPPLHSPLYVKEQHRFLLNLDNRPLQDAVERYIAEDPACKSWQQTDQKSCSWKLVLEELENAKALYHDKGRGNPFRRGFRHGAGLVRNIGPLLAGIPQDNGVGLLQGALRIIFHAIKRRSDTCDRIFSVFKRIPVTLIRAEEFRQLHPNEESFLHCLGSLHHELTRCIPQLIDILLRRGIHSTIKKHTKSVFGDGLAELDGVLKPVKEAEESLRHRQTLLDSRGITEALSHSRSADEKLDDVRQKVTEISLKQADLNSTISNLSPEFQEYVVDMSKQMKEQHLQATLNMSETMNKFFELVQEMLQMPGHGWGASNTAPRLDNPAPKRRAQHRLVGSVSVSACTREEQDIYRQDLQAVQRAYHNFDNKSMEHANYLLLTHRFMEWLTDSGSDMLLVDAHCSGKGVGKISPMSVLCAGLGETLFVSAMQDDPARSIPYPPQIVLTFFAGQHTNRGNVLAGPHGMMRCLIDQLLDQWPDDAPSIDVNPDALDPEAFRSADTGFLCHIFEDLLLQLGPEYRVCCIIDGISYFETRLCRWEDELKDVVESFLGIINRQREEVRSVYDMAEVAPVKFLLTSPEKSIRIRSVVPIDSHVDLRAGNTNARSWLPSPGR